MVGILFHYHPLHTYKHSSISSFLKTEDTEKTDTPVYVTRKRVIYNGEQYDAAFYSLFFVLNPGYLCNIGRHEGDVEKLIILSQNEEPRWVYFGAHSSGEGEWVRWEDCEKTSKGGIKVYIALGSNGFYKRPGTYIRVFGFANDVCSNRGQMVMTRPEDFVDSSKQSWSETHYQVRRGINTPLHTPNPSVVSITSYERFMLAFLKGKIDKREKLQEVA